MWKIYQQLDTRRKTPHLTPPCIVATSFLLSFKWKLVYVYVYFSLFLQLKMSHFLLYRVIPGIRNHGFWPSQRVSKHTLMKSETQPASVVSIDHQETATPASEFLQTPRDCDRVLLCFVSSWPWHPTVQKKNAEKFFFCATTRCGKQRGMSCAILLILLPLRARLACSWQ